MIELFNELTLNNSNMWRKNQTQDSFYRKAKLEGFRSRAAYKLLELQKKFKLINKNTNVMDLGCAPGSWLQVAKQFSNGFICGFDLLNINLIHNVHFGQIDCFDTKAVDDFLLSKKAPDKFELILSDMSPNISGDKFGDHVMSMDMLMLFRDFCERKLKGYGVCKVFDGPQLSDAIKLFSGTVRRFKPAASRADSSELYLIFSQGPVN